MSYNRESYLDTRTYLALRMVYFENINKKKIIDY